MEGNDEKRYIPFDFPKTSGLDVDNRGFFNGDWLSWSFSVSAFLNKLNKLLSQPKPKLFR